MSALKTRASGKRVKRLAGLVAVAAMTMMGLGLMAGPATATDGNTGSVDTSTATVTTNPGVFTDKGQGGDDDLCTGDNCKKINWCDGGGRNPHLNKVTDDAPMVLTRGGDKGDEHRCIKRPQIDYKCCVPTDKGNVNAVAVTNRAKYPFKIKVQLGDGEPVVRWVKPGETVDFRFKDVANGEHKLVAAVWAGGRSWCVFKVKHITVNCPKPTPSTSSPTPTPSVSTSTSPSTSPSVSPSASTSTTPAPGGGGGDNEPQLPVTGSSTGVVVGLGSLLVVAGGVMLFVYRRHRRQVRFTA